MTTLRIALALSVLAASPALADFGSFELPRLDWPAETVTPAPQPTVPVTRACVDPARPSAPATCVPSK